MTGYRLPSTPAAAIKQQIEIARKVVDRDDFGGKIELVCGVDVSYRKGVAHCAAVVVDSEMNVVQHASTKSAVRHPYIPGLFMLREAGPVLRTLKRVKYDLLLVDGHGRLHPRRCGLACYIGVAVDKPAIGVAKSLLAGRVRNDGYVEIGGEVLGCAMDGLYVSVGHRVSLGTAVGIVRKFTRTGQRLPEPLRLADMYSKIRP